MIKRIYRKIKRTFAPKTDQFDLTGERVDIWYKNKINYDELDMFQKNHYKRYEYAFKLIEKNDICGDFACGTGYGSVILAKKARRVIGADINVEVIAGIQKRYENIPNVTFINADLLNLALDEKLDKIISFETIEHFTEENIQRLLRVYNSNLKPGGQLIISTPYMQEMDEQALKLGHHLTFYIDENKITDWLSAAGFEIADLKYQNYQTHTIENDLENKEFILVAAKKK